MDFLRKLRRSSVDVPSTPTAPKMGKIPLPSLDSPLLSKSPLAHAREEEDVIVVDRYPSPSPPRKRSGSTTVSRGVVNPIHIPRAHTPSHHPHPHPHSYSHSHSQPRHTHPTPSPELYAPTPKWQTQQRTLLDHDWASCSPCPSPIATPDPHALAHKAQTYGQTHTHTHVRPNSRVPYHSSSPVPRASSSRSGSGSRMGYGYGYGCERAETESPGEVKRQLKQQHRRQRQLHHQREEERCGKRVDSPYVESELEGEGEGEGEGGEGENVKRPLKGILKTALPKSVRSETTELHWQLLPYDPTRCRKKLYFDVAMPPDLIRDHTRLPPVALSPAELDKWATAPLPSSTTTTNDSKNTRRPKTPNPNPNPNTPPTTQRMHIKCTLHPHWDLDIIVHNDQGVRCRDVFEAIHRSLMLRLTEYERRVYVGGGGEGERGEVEEAFWRRCRERGGGGGIGGGGEGAAERRAREREGLLRVDLLKGRRIFMGLTRPVDGGEFWWLHLGLPKVD